MEVWPSEKLHVIFQMNSVAFFHVFISTEASTQCGQGAADNTSDSVELFDPFTVTVFSRGAGGAAEEMRSQLQRGFGSWSESQELKEKWRGRRSSKSLLRL